MFTMQTVPATEFPPRWIVATIAKREAEQAAGINRIEDQFGVQAGGVPND
jgi:hypothetical protein